MTGRRAQAYGRVALMLQQIGAAKLLPREQARIRAAADALLFCAAPTADPHAIEAFRDVCDLEALLVGSQRWTAESADRLLDDLWACGPGMDAKLAVAA
jgi:hypothetical protein